ncbi:MAG: OadG family protein [Clostridia bacterium]|nr:OadG family protein [Clostridia bacterium]
MTELSLMEKFADPTLIPDLSMAERLQGAGITALMGMGVTFSILILLWFAVAMMTRIFKAAAKKPAAPAAPAASAAPAPTPSAAPVAPAANDDQLVAVIAAAIAAYEGSGAASNLVVRKITRISGPDTAWSVAGHQDCAESRRF